MPEKPWYIRNIKAYVGIADSDGLRSFVSEGDVPDGFLCMVLEVKAAQGQNWACFWAAVDEQTADEVRDELVSGQRRDALNLLLVLARDIVHYPISKTSHEADLFTLFSPDFAVHDSPPKDHAPHSPPFD